MPKQSKKRHNPAAVPASASDYCPTLENLEAAKRAAIDAVAAWGDILQPNVAEMAQCGRTDPDVEAVFRRYWDRLAQLAVPFERSTVMPCVRWLLRSGCSKGPLRGLDGTYSTAHEAALSSVCTAYLLWQKCRVQTNTTSGRVPKGSHELLVSFGWFYNEAGAAGWPDPSEFIASIELEHAAAQKHLPAWSAGQQAGTDTNHAAGGDLAGEKAGRLGDIQPKARQALEEFDKACESQGQADMTDWEAYKLIKRTYEMAGEIDELPTFETWQRRLRRGRAATGRQKNNPRAGRTGSAPSIGAAGNL